MEGARGYPTFANFHLIPVNKHILQNAHSDSCEDIAVRTLCAIRRVLSILVVRTCNDSDGKFVKREPSPMFGEKNTSCTQ